MIEVRGNRLGLPVEDAADVVWVREDEIAHIAEYVNGSFLTMRTPFYEVERNDGTMQYNHQVAVAASVEDILMACVKASQGKSMKSPAEILTALAALWSRISSAIGRGQAEAAKSQQSEIDAMDREIQGMEKEHTNGT